MSQYKSSFVNELTEKIRRGEVKRKPAQFRADLRPALTRLVQSAVSMYSGHSGSFADYPLNQGAEYWKTALLVKEGMREIGIELDDAAAFAMWELYSEDLSAQWMLGPSTASEAVAVIEQLCDDIAKGQDYLGLAGKEQP